MVKFLQVYLNYIGLYHIQIFQKCTCFFQKMTSLKQGNKYLIKINQQKLFQEWVHIDGYFQQNFIILIKFQPNLAKSSNNLLLHFNITDEKQQKFIDGHTRVYILVRLGEILLKNFK
eukprot:TRINITY_DN2062_c2_g1_i1.p2 TRINITY_DN2062_c2_g1~~TRINITY_DN2062_c2_g1_i1.p2  ORF type:complete len:117 (+),score=4.96 TRINITY_DN2062_c2_g1_i1:420-770(+)